MHNIMGSLALSGIESIDIVPDPDYPSVVKRLRNSISKSDTLRAAVAYWTIESDKISDKLALKFSGEGFLCVDINYPTDIDDLNRLSTMGGNIYLHLLKPNPQPGELRIKMPPHLMHAKTLLFDFDENKAELWVGSHNWTARALSGLNFEASTITNLSITSDLYQSAENLLNSIRSACVLFDPDLVDYYKWLQGQNIEGVEWIVDLEGENAGNFSGERISLFLNSDQDFRNLKKVDKIIKLSVQESGSGQVYLYEARIMDTGYVKKSGLDYGNRYYAFHSGKITPTIEGPAVPQTSKIKKTKFWATVEITSAAPNLQPDFVGADFLGLPDQARWLIQKNDPFESRVNDEDRFLFIKSSKPLIQRPLSAEAFKGNVPSKLEINHLKQKQLGEKPLIRKAIIPK